jgi:hypothetical protein
MVVWCDCRRRVLDKSKETQNTRVTAKTLWPQSESRGTAEVRAVSTESKNTGSCFIKQPKIVSVSAISVQTVLQKKAMALLLQRK